MGARHESVVLQRRVRSLDRTEDLACHVRTRLVVARFLLKRVDLIVFLTVVAVIGIYTRGAVNAVDTRARAEAASTHNSLCTFRADLEKRADQSQAFLDDHPEGFPGIPAPVIQNSIDNQRRTLDSLRSLNCAKETP